MLDKQWCVGRRQWWWYSGQWYCCWLLVAGVPTVGGLLVVRVVCTPLLLVAASFHSLAIEPTSIHPRPFSFVRSSSELLLLQQTKPQERLRFFQRAHTMLWHFHILQAKPLMFKFSRKRCFMYEIMRYQCYASCSKYIRDRSKKSFHSIVNWILSTFLSFNYFCIFFLLSRFFFFFIKYEF